MDDDGNAGAERNVRRAPDFQDPGWYEDEGRIRSFAQFGAVHPWSQERRLGVGNSRRRRWEGRVPFAHCSRRESKDGDLLHVEGECKEKGREAICTRQRHSACDTGQWATFLSIQIYGLSTK